MAALDTAHESSALSEELRGQLEARDVVPFVGAGLSIGAGLPGWTALVRPLAAQVDYELPTENKWVTAEHLVAALQYYENRYGRNSLIQHLRARLDTIRVSGTPVHRLLASWPVEVIFTTNYDDLVEKALREAGRALNVIVSEPELAFWSDQAVQVVKVCGDLYRPQSIVATRRDYTTYAATHSRIVERIRTTLEGKAALFVGYSLQDPFFNQIWDNIGLDFGALRRWGYAALFDAEPLEIDDLRLRGIHPLNFRTQGRDRTQVLLEWLQQTFRP